MIEQWGLPLGEVMRIGDRLAIPGLIFGNVFVGIQPPRGFGADPMAIYHSPDLPPTHHYLAYYRWLQHEFGAQAVLHMGKHGNLEWLPGKATALSDECYPEIMLSDLPNFYPYIINNPGEGTQAKRRGHAVIVDHLIPPMTEAETYDDLARLEQLLDEYYRMASLDPSKLPYITQQIWTIVTKNNLDRDLKVDRCPEAEEFDHFLQEIDGYSASWETPRSATGCTSSARPREGEQRVGLIQAMMRLDNGEVPSIRKAFAGRAGHRLRPIVGDELGTPLGDDIAGASAVLAEPRRRARPAEGEKTTWTRGDLSDSLDDAIRVWIDREDSTSGIPSLERHAGPSGCRRTSITASSSATRSSPASTARPTS